MASTSSCRHCGSSVLEKDAARGNTVCTNCGAVLEENAIVAEVEFQETGAGGHSVVGQFVSADGSSKLNVGGVTADSRQSREVTIQNTKRRMQLIASQMRLNYHCVETALNFFKMALSRGLTRGRSSAMTIGACMYITCRLEGTPHFLLDFSDALRVDIYSLGRTFNNLARSLYITLPSSDPCVYIMRFANALQFGDKEHEVAMVALRLVQRMKRDWMAFGRRPTGLCGAALLLAARYHNFNRSVTDVVRVVNIGESVIRRRLSEFAATPSSSLTLDDFQTVDLEDECDPPIFTQSKTPKAKGAQFTLLNFDNVIENLEPDMLKTEKEILAALDKKSKQKSVGDKTPKSEPPKIDTKKRQLTASKSSTAATGTGLVSSSSKLLHSLVDVDSDSSLEDDEVAISREYLHKQLREILVSTDEQRDVKGNEEKKTPLGKFQQYRPTLESLGITSKPSTNVGSSNGSSLIKNPQSDGCTPDSREKSPETGELDITGIDDDEIDCYLLREDEINIKRRLWAIHYEPYMLEVEQKRVKREEEQKMLESQGLAKKRRKPRAKPSTAQQPAASFNEAVEKIVQEKKLSSKINYDVLKSLIEPSVVVVQAGTSSTSAVAELSAENSQRQALTDGVHSGTLSDTQASQSGTPIIVTASSDCIRTKVKPTLTPSDTSGDANKQQPTVAAKTGRLMLNRAKLTPSILIRNPAKNDSKALT